MSYHLASMSKTALRGLSSLGASPNDVLADNTTPAEREYIAAMVSQLVFDWSNKIQSVLDGRLSLSSMFSRGAIFSMTAFDARASMQRAKEQLNGQFLEAATNAVRDYNRPLAEIKETIIAYIDNLEKQMQAALKSEERSRIAAIFEEAVNVAAKAGRKVADSISGNTPAWVVALIVVASVGTIGYTVRSFR